MSLRPPVSPKPLRNNYISSALSKITHLLSSILPNSADFTTLTDPDSLFLPLPTHPSFKVHYKHLPTPRPTSPPANLFLGVHGFGANLSTWTLDSFPALLSAVPSSEALAYDSPGFGLTSRPSLFRLGWYRHAFAVNILRALISTASSRARPVLLGSSIGARAALALALDGNARRVRGVVLVAPGLIASGSGRQAGFLWRAFGAVAKIAALAVSLLLFPVLQVVLRVGVANMKFWVRGLSMARGDGQVPQRYLDAYRRPLAMRGWVSGILNFTRSMVLESQANIAKLVEGIGESGVPVLIVHGSKDRVIPLSNSQELVKRIPGARLVVMEGFGHLPQEEAPKEFAEIVAKWLDGLPV